MDVAEATGAGGLTDPIDLLIVEDVETDLELVTSELRRGGLSFTSRHAESRSEFFAAIDSRLPDLVLTDYNLPDIDGMAVVRELAARSELTPVIIVTGSLDEETAVGCLKGGATDYILKDHLSRLVPSVRAALELRRLRMEELRARQEIVRARDFYVTLLDEFPNPVWRAGAEAKCDYVNKAWLAFTGRTLEDELGDGWTAGIHPDDLTPTMASCFAAFDARQPFLSEYRLRHTDGSYHWLAMYGRPIYGLDGSFAGCIGSAYDVQPHHDLQQKIESQWRFLESILDHIDQIVYVFDDDDVIRFANRTAVSARGIKRHELLGRSLHDFATITQESWEAYERAKATRSHVRFESIVIPTHFGTRPIYDGWLIPFVGPDGARGVIASFTDVTQRVEAEATQRLLMTAIEHAEESILITDAEGRIEYVNPSFEATTGYSAAEALGHNPKMLKSGLHDQEFYNELWSTIASGKVWRGNLINRRKDGTTYHEEASISPVPDANGKLAHFVAVKRDLSREVELEQQLSQAQKLDAVGRLAGGIAHDFNNLLGVIRGYTELLAGSLDESHPGQTRLAQMQKATDRAASLTRQLLAFGRRQVLQPRVVDFNLLLGESRELLRQLLPESIDLEIVASSEPATVLVDHSQMEQVIFNLAVNARDAMPTGGTFRIATSVADVDDDATSFRDAAGAGRWIRVTISDTGIGIAYEKLVHIFEPFFTTRAGSGGTGLGLSTVYGIVRQSGGNIYVRSELGQGTTFTIYLPWVDAPAELPAEREPSVPPRRAARPATVLIAEDVDLLREMIREGLEAAGMTVLDARDGAEAIEVSRRETGPIDILLTDVIMPKVSGLELEAMMQRERPGLQTLFMSGYTSDVIAATGVLEEGVNLLQKPFTIDELVERIHMVLGDAE